ncbi:hypothetical protein [Pseudomonas sp. UMAB-40]|uniref:hypothetical protein n=1 Tax=Pseudomonas sp. UMAB-40 TaxID=1365407 RepID=UPI001C57BA22|nr:hypothetical protein [Pseudomonas sp. UMAB-40]
MSEFQIQKERWETVGFELRSLESQRFYLTRTYQDVIFIVRHATDTVVLPSTEHSFRVCFKDRESGILNSETRRATGLDALLDLILKWRHELRATGYAVQPTPSLLMIGHQQGQQVRVSRPVEHV